MRKIDEVWGKSKEDLGLIKESLEPKDFMLKCEEIFKKKFTQGFFFGRISSNFGTESMSIHLGLIKDERDCSSGIRENDPMYHILSYYPKKGVTMLDNDTIEFKSLKSGISVNPEKGSYMAMSIVKTKPRSSTSGLEKQLKTFEKWVDTLHKTMKASIPDVYGLDKIDKKYLAI